MKINDAQKRANDLLFTIAHLSQDIEQIEAAAIQETTAITEKYNKRLAPLVAARKELDKRITQTMKGNVSEIFDGADKVTLDHGILLHLEKMKVTIPRDALEKIEDNGWNEAVKIAKSVDRAVVKNWPEERLVVIGAKKTLKDVYEYEIINRRPIPST